MLCWFLLSNKGNQLDVYIYPLPLEPASHLPILLLGHHGALSRDSSTDIYTLYTTCIPYTLYTIYIHIYHMYAIYTVYHIYMSIPRVYHIHCIPYIYIYTTCVPYTLYTIYIRLYHMYTIYTIYHIYTYIPCVRYRACGKLLCSTRSSAQCSVMRGLEFWYSNSGHLNSGNLKKRHYLEGEDLGI